MKHPVRMILSDRTGFIFEYPPKCTARWPHSLIHVGDMNRMAQNLVESSRPEAKVVSQLVERKSTGGVDPGYFHRNKKRISIREKTL